MIPALDSCIPMYDPTFMTQGLVMVPCGPASDVVTCKPGTEDPVSGASNATDTPAEANPSTRLKRPTWGVTGRTTRKTAAQARSIGLSTLMDSHHPLNSSNQTSDYTEPYDLEGASNLDTFGEETGPENNSQPKKRSRRKISVDELDANGRPLSKDEIRKKKRRITNRESARRMRVKRQVEQDNLKAQNKDLKQRLNEWTTKYRVLEAEHRQTMNNNQATHRVLEAQNEWFKETAKVALATLDQNKIPRPTLPIPPPGINPPTMAQVAGPPYSPHSAIPPAQAHGPRAQADFPSPHVPWQPPQHAMSPLMPAHLSEPQQQQPQRLHDWSPAAIGTAVAIPDAGHEGEFDVMEVIDSLGEGETGMMAALGNFNPAPHPMDANAGPLYHVDWDDALPNDTLQLPEEFFQGNETLI